MCANNSNNENIEEDYWRVRIPKPSTITKKMKDLLDKQISNGQCSKCGKPISSDFKICPYCATPISEVTASPQYTASPSCRKCGKKLVKGSKFCIGCGTPVKKNKKPTRKTSKKIRHHLSEKDMPTQSTLQKSKIDDDKNWWEIGDDYYSQRDYVKAGECYDKAQDLEQSINLEYSNALAYLTIKTAKERGIELYRLRPGIAVSFSSPQKLELERGQEMNLILILFNGSEKKVRVNVTPDFPKEILKRDSFSIELFPGQYVGHYFPVKATDKTPLKKYKPTINLRTEAIKYRAAEKGLEFASKTASRLLPFSGILIDWLGAKGLKNEVSLSLPLTVKEGFAKWTIMLGTKEEDMGKLQLYDAIKGKWDIEEEFFKKLINVLENNKNFEYGAAIHKITTSWGEDWSQRPLFLITVKFKMGAETFSGKKFRFLIAPLKKSGFRLCAVDDLDMTKNIYNQILKTILETPSKLEELIVFITLEGN